MLRILSAFFVIVALTAMQIEVLAKGPDYPRMTFKEAESQHVTARELVKKYHDSGSKDHLNEAVYRYKISLQNGYALSANSYIMAVAANPAVTFEEFQEHNVFVIKTLKELDADSDWYRGHILEQLGSYFYYLPNIQTYDHIKKNPNFRHITLENKEWPIIVELYEKAHELGDGTASLKLHDIYRRSSINYSPYENMPLALRYLDAALERNALFASSRLKVLQRDYTSKQISRMRNDPNYVPKKRGEKSFLESFLSSAVKGASAEASRRLEEDLAEFERKHGKTALTIEKERAAAEKKRVETEKRKRQDEQAAIAQKKEDKRIALIEKWWHSIDRRSHFLAHHRKGTSSSVITGSVDLYNTVGTEIGFYSINGLLTDGKNEISVRVYNNSPCKLQFNGQFETNGRPFKVIDWGIGSILEPKASVDLKGELFINNGYDDTRTISFVPEGNTLECSF